MGTSETNSSISIQPQVWALCAHLLATTHSYITACLYSTIMKQEAVYQPSSIADMCTVPGYSDLGLARFSLSVLNKRQAARKCTGQSAAALHFVCTRGHSRCAFYQSSELDSLESRGYALSRVRADRAVLHVLISIDISHRVFSHASTEVSPILILSHILLCW